jgi:hypothetical protein
MIDEAFLPFREIIDKLTSFNGGFENTEEGVRSYIYEFTVETPVEMDVVVDEHDKVQLGTVPPLYDVHTTFRPSYHTIRFTAVLSEENEPEYGAEYTMEP